LEDHEEPSVEFRYYMIRVQAPRTEHDPEVAPALSGIVERIGSGEKRQFSDAAELVRHVAGWSDAGSNMEGGANAGNV